MWTKIELFLSTVFPSTTSYKSYAISTKHINSTLYWLLHFILNLFFVMLKHFVDCYRTNEWSNDDKNMRSNMNRTTKINSYIQVLSSLPNMCERFDKSSHSNALWTSWKSYHNWYLRSDTDSFMNRKRWLNCWSVHVFWIIPRFCLSVKCGCNRLSGFKSSIEVISFNLWINSTHRIESLSAARGYHHWIVYTIFCSCRHIFVILNYYCEWSTHIILNAER